MSAMDNSCLSLLNHDKEEIDLTLSEDEGNDNGDVNNAASITQQPPQPQPVKSEHLQGYEGLTPATTGGKGLWSLWTRNFKSTLLMAMDLVDNSVDAAMQQKKDTGNDSFTGRVQIYRDLYEVMPEQVYTTGLCIRNNAPKQITPLKEVLKLFISDKKDSGTDSVGENGVGLKQSCAALSDLSFALVKNKGTFELGILAKSLQKEEGFFLPSFEFNVVDSKTIGQQMMDVFCQANCKEVADCIAEYGRVRIDGGSPSLARGVARLAKHFEDINTKFFGNEYVFEVIIDKVVHRGSTSASQDEKKNAAVSDIIKELQHEIPRRYLHIPDSLKFTVGKKKLSFKYWTERLVEFSRVEIPVRTQTPWSVDFGEITPDSYELKVYIGFDRYRITNSESGPCKSKKACSLYVYSRASGRMIQYDEDARLMLGLTGGGTDFCQALTVLVDDSEGHLPLDPTKQYIAFGNQERGNMHEENLFSVVHAVVKFYWRYHVNKYSGSKKALTEKITKWSKEEVPTSIKMCGDSELTDYKMRFNLNRDNRILVDHSCYKDEEIEEIGPDTLFRLLPIDSGRKKKPARKRAASFKRDKQDATATSKSPPTKKKRTSSKAVTPSPTKKKQATTKGKHSESRKQPAKRKQLDNMDAWESGKKKGATRQPARSKGSRASSRESIPTQRFGKYSQSESEDEDDDEGKDSGTVKVANTSKKTSEEDELIDLCSSSDEEEDEKKKAPDNVTSMNDNGMNEEDEDNTNTTTLVTEITGLRSENSDLKAKVAALQTENDSLEKEVKRLREEMECSKSAPTAE